MLNNLNIFQKALILCAHTDDEFGCAGTIIRLLSSGVEVRYIALSKCEESVPDGYPQNILEIECRKCTKRLGIKESLTEVLNYPVRHFPSLRQEILELFISLNREFQPELVALPSSFDTHQDHITVFQEGFRAFKHSSILGYELPQNFNSFTNTAFIKLTEEQIGQKISALSSYESQTFRNHSSPDYIRSLARVRGVQCHAPYAEAFEVIRLVI